MKFSFILLISLQFSTYLFSQDSIVKNDSLNHRIELFLFGSPLQKMPGFGVSYSLQKLKFSTFVSFSHNNILVKDDSINIFLPYAVNDSTLYYEIRSYTNQKYLIGFGLESKFRLTKNNQSYQIGLNFISGKYSFQDYYAKAYYNFYRDSLTGNVYYEDIYGDPSWDQKDAFAQILTFSKADMEFRIYGLEPYLSISAPSKKRNISSGIQLGARFSYYNMIKNSYLDYANILTSPHNDFQKLSFFLRLNIIILISS